MLLQYDGVVNIIRRGDFKKLDQELETGWKRGMFNFDKSSELRSSEGFSSSAKVAHAEFDWDQAEQYVREQQEIVANTAETPPGRASD